MKTHLRNPKRVAPDTIMTNVMKCLVGDLQACLDNPVYFFDVSSALRTSDIHRIREATATLTENATNAYEFKCAYQLQNLLKRYRYRKDIFTDDALTKEAVSKFLKVQSHIAEVRERPRNNFWEAVLDTAALYVARTLGTYDVNEHRTACGFGPGATVGVRSRNACEAARWECPISGSTSQISWFSEFVVSENPHIQTYWNERMSTVARKDVPYNHYERVDCLTMTLVPKSYKSLRSIVPNTTLGSYISGGLGRMIARRLKRNGYDIEKLQMQHRNRARLASETGIDATMDLSSASDLISRDLVMRLLPSDWFDELDRCRIGTVKLPGHAAPCQMETFGTMGIGYTFELETLIFLSLLKAIERWTDSFRPRGWARISVYGDDMIFHKDLMPGVTRLFDYVGLIINFDKTYDEGPFRESCGGDYYHGVDVRPFQPETPDTIVGQRAYTALIYKFINGLIRRWTEWEIPRTLEYLTSLLAKKPIYLVPFDFPDDCGIHCRSAQATPHFLKGLAVSKPKPVGHGLFRFTYLRFSSDRTKEERHEPYYWLAINKEMSSTYRGHCDISFATQERQIQKRIGSLVGLPCREKVLLENTKRMVEVLPTSIVGPPQLLRVDLATYVTVRHTGSYTRHSGTSTFNVP